MNSNPIKIPGPDHPILHLELDQLTPALSIQESLYWHEHRSALVLDRTCSL